MKKNYLLNLQRNVKALKEEFESGAGYLECNDMMSVNSAIFGLEAEISYLIREAETEVPLGTTVLDQSDRVTIDV